MSEIAQPVRRDDEPDHKFKDEQRPDDVGKEPEQGVQPSDEIENDQPKPDEGEDRRRRLKKVVDFLKERPAL